MRDRSLPLSPLVLDRWRLMLPSRPVRRGKRTPSRPRARPDRGGGRTGASGGREPALLAHPREQCECAGTLRQAGGALRVHPISQTFLTRFVRAKMTLAVTAPIVSKRRLFLGVARSACGRTWRDRLDEPGAGRAL